MATSPLASTGIGSGLDVNGIVESLMAVERRPLDLLASQQATYESRISAYGVLKGALGALQTAVAGLTTGNPFRSMSATLSDALLGSVAAGKGAIAGAHSIEVTALAASHRIASGGFVAQSDAVGSGTLTFSFGSWNAGAFTANPSAATGTVTIAAGQSSLAGIRDAVNAAKIGVSASIVDDGTAAGKRLVFTSSTGEAMSMKVDVVDDDGNALDAAGLSQLAYDPAGTAGAGRNMEQKVAAQNAAMIIDGIAITKATNVVSDAIKGLTLTLSKTNAGSPGTIHVANDSQAGSKAMDAFVKAYNDVQKTITNLSRYDPAKRQASVLTGDATVRMVQSKLRSLIAGPVAGGSGVSGELSMLAQVGVKTALDGTLSVDAAKLGALLSSDPLALERLFSAVGTSTDALVGFAGATAKTKPGNHAVEVTQLASRGTLVGSGAAALTITAGVNDTLTATIDNVAVTVTLAARTYANADALAAELAGRLNGAQALKDAGSSVAVLVAGGILSVMSARYGSASNVAFTGTALTTLMGGAGSATAGVDVAGLIGGVAALGAGRTLTGAAGSPSEGLKLTVDGGLVGPRGTVNYSQGIASLFEPLLDDLTDSDGLVAAKTEGVQESLKLLDRRKDALEARMERVEAAYRAQYVRLDTTIATMSSLSTYLTQQLANLPKPYDDGG